LQIISAEKLVSEECIELKPWALVGEFGYSGRMIRLP